MNFSYGRYLYNTLPRPGAFPPPIVQAAFRNMVAPPLRPGMTEIDYHADVQREMVQTLRGAGNRIEENVRLLTIPPGPNWTYDADWILKPADTR